MHFQPILYLSIPFGLSSWVGGFSRSVMSNSWQPHGLVACQAPLSMEYSRKEYWSGLPFPSPEDLPNPEIKRRSPTWQADSLPAEPPGKPKNSGVDSLSLLHWVFLIQELNWGLLHCRWILCQLRYLESPAEALTEPLIWYHYLGK